jgi:hypothetical protein
MPDAPTEVEAHAGLVPPLRDDGTQCVSCHGAASATLAQRYATTSSESRDAAAGADAGFAAGPPSPASLPPGPDLRSNDMPAGVLAAVLAVLGLAWILTRERLALRRWRESWMRDPRTSPPGDRS